MIRVQRLTDGLGERTRTVGVGKVGVLVDEMEAYELLAGCFERIIGLKLLTLHKRLV